MNKKYARELSSSITNEELAIMLSVAKKFIDNWQAVSIVNKGMTKGAVWNILAKNFDVDEKYHVLAKQNMIREFGKYLPVHLRQKVKVKAISKPPFHEKPIFN